MKLSPTIVSHYNYYGSKMLTCEPVQIHNLGFRPGPTQTDLYSHRSKLHYENMAMQYTEIFIVVKNENFL